MRQSAARVSARLKEKKRRMSYLFSIKLLFWVPVHDRNWTYRANQSSLRAIKLIFEGHEKNWRYDFFFSNFSLLESKYKVL